MRWTLSLALSLTLLASVAQAKEKPRVELDTTLGKIVIELEEDKAPISVKNFLQYVDDKFYDGTIFHRVIDGFMIQGGGFTADLQRKETRPPIKNEASNGLKNKRGTLAMARTSHPDSATAQFFVNVIDNVGLDRPKPDGHGYAVFGQVVSGMDVIDKLRVAKTGPKGPFGRDCPQTTVEIKTARRVTAPAKK